MGHRIAARRTAVVGVAARRRARARPTPRASSDRSRSGRTTAPCGSSRDRAQQVGERPGAALVTPAATIGVGRRIGAPALARRGGTAGCGGRPDRPRRAPSSSASQRVLHPREQRAGCRSSARDRSPSRSSTRSSTSSSGPISSTSSRSIVRPISNARRSSALPFGRLVAQFLADAARPAAASAASDRPRAECRAAPSGSSSGPSVSSRSRSPTTAMRGISSAGLPGMADEGLGHASAPRARSAAAASAGRGRARDRR